MVQACTWVTCLSAIEVLVQPDAFQLALALKAMQTPKRAFAQRFVLLSVPSKSNTSRKDRPKVGLHVVVNGLTPLPR